MGVACLEFRGENFCGWRKIAKFVKVFSLESFPLYSSYMWLCIHVHVCSCIPRPKAGSGDEATNVLYMYVHEGVTVVPSLSALL